MSILFPYFIHCMLHFSLPCIKFPVQKAGLEGTLPRKFCRGDAGRISLPRIKFPIQKTELAGLHPLKLCRGNTEQAEGGTVPGLVKQGAVEVVQLAGDIRSGWHRALVADVAEAVVLYGDGDDLR